MNIEKPWLARCTTQVASRLCADHPRAGRRWGAWHTEHVAELDDVKRAVLYVFSTASIHTGASTRYMVRDGHHAVLQSRLGTRDQQALRG
jgi:hypothetical protein